MPKVTFWMSEGALFSSVSVLIDAFAIANLWHCSLEEKESAPLFQTEILTIDGEPVTALGNIPVMPHGAVDENAATDCLVIAPTLPNVTPISASLGRWIAALRRDAVPIATVCTGTFILAELDLLDGKTATTNWKYARMFQKRYPRVNLNVQYILTEDDGILCTGAATAVYHLALHLIRRFGSKKGLFEACIFSLLLFQLAMLLPIQLMEIQMP